MDENKMKNMLFIMHKLRTAAVSVSRVDEDTDLEEIAVILENAAKDIRELNKEMKED